MLSISRVVDASPDQVWDVLSDGWLFPAWVVGASHMRAVDAEWPAEGARLHHSVGAWPVLITDTTSVVRCVPGELLELEARGRPVGLARVIVRLRAVGERTEVTLEEDASGGPMRLIPGPVRKAMLAPRNRECLTRLAQIAEGRARNATRHA